MASARPGQAVRIRLTRARGEVVVVTVEGGDLGIPFPATIIDDVGVGKTAALTLQLRPN